MSAQRFPTTNLILGAAILLLASAAPLFSQGLPLTMSKSFTPSTVTIGGTATTTMSVTITNPNAFTVSGISFSDTYPAGLVPDQVGAYTCSAGSAAFTGSGWALNNVTLGAGASCVVPMLMHATITGPIVNTTSQVTGTGVPPGGPATATLNVAAAATPTLSEWMLILLVLTLGTISLIAIKERPRRAAE
jgi:hypothetical protein